jgi:hypothetical protein
VFDAKHDVQGATDRGDARDCWKWYSDPDKGYSVKRAYHLLTHFVLLTVAAHYEIIWNNITSLKVSLFIWRLLNNRLLLKDILVHVCWLVVHGPLSNIIVDHTLQF